MTVPTANIIISEDKDAVNKALQKLGSTASMFTSDKDNVLLFSTQGNSNIISFEYNMMGSDTDCILEIIDPKNEFEELYMSTESVFLSLARYLNFENSSKKNEIEKSEEEEVLKSTRELKTLSDADLNKIVKSSQTKYFYLSFGVGTNREYWSPIQRLQIIGIVLDPTKARRITLRFATVPRPLSKDNRQGLYNENVDVNFLGYNTRFTAYSDEIQFAKNDFNGLPLYEGLDNEDFDIHKLITDTLSRFIKKYTGDSNVLVVLPNLNKMLSDVWEKVKTENDTGENRLENKKASVSALLEKLGMSLIATQSPYVVQPNKVVASLWERVATAGNPFKAQENLYKNSHFYASIQVDDTGKTPDVLGEIRKIVNNIIKYSAGTEGYLPRAVYLSESDAEKLQLLDDFIPGGEFIESFNANKDTYILGDSNIIDAMVYAGILPKGPIPISKLDFYRFNVGYRKKTFNSLKIKDARYELGNLYQVPDKFAFADAAGVEEAEQLSAKEAVPVFRYNTENPNVISIKAMEESTLMAYLNMSFALNVNRAGQYVKEDGKVTERENDFEITTQAQMAKYVITNKHSVFGPALTNQEIIEDLLEKASPDLVNKIYDKGGYEDRQKVIASFVEALARNTEGMKLELDEEFVKAPTQILDYLADQVTRAARILTIETVPFFNLATRGALVTKPSILLYQDAPVKTSGKVNRTKFNTYLTGVYLITGVKHKISSGKASSTFRIAKSQLTTFSEQKTKAKKEETPPKQTAANAWGSNVPGNNAKTY